MKKYFIILLLLFSSMSVYADLIPCLEGIGPLLPGQVYCTDVRNSLFNFVGGDHYELRYQSAFTHYYDVTQSNYEDNIYYIDFGLDLNNVIPTKPMQDYRIYEVYDFYNWVRPTASKTQIDNYEEYRTLTAEYSDINKDAYDFVGMPIHLYSCFIDCDALDNVPAQIWELSNTPFGDYWYQTLLSMTAPADWYNNRYPADREFRDYYNTYRFENNYYACNYDSTGLKQIVMGCTFEVDDFLRDPNIDSTFDFWGMNDIIPNAFADAPDNVKTWTLRQRIDINIGVSEDNYTVTQVNDTAFFTRTDLMGSEPNDVSIVEQNEIYLLKENAELQNVWMTTVLKLSSTLFVVLMFVFYLVSLFILMFFFFGSFPYIFKKFNEKLEKLSDVKIKERFK